jgi:hypothetical protein
MAAMAARQDRIDLRGTGMRRAVFACLVASCVAVSGCFFPAYQTPEALPPGEVSLGPVATYGYTFRHYGDPSEERPGELELGLMARVGIVPNIEAGFRASCPLGVMVDAKYQFLRGRLLMAADLGLSVSPSPFQLIWYPMLLVGTERYYAGLKAMYVREFDQGYVPSPNTSSLIPGLLFGASFGRRLRVLPELNVFYYQDGDPIERMLVAGGGFCLQYRF